MKKLIYVFKTKNPHFCLFLCWNAGQSKYCISPSCCPVSCEVSVRLCYVLGLIFATYSAMGVFPLTVKEFAFIHGLLLYNLPRSYFLSVIGHWLVIPIKTFSIWWTSKKQNKTKKPFCLSNYSCNNFKKTLAFNVKQTP